MGISSFVKILTFVLKDEEYGIPIQRVREVIPLLEITSVPKSPAHIQGVINLRGNIMPVIDLRMKFGMEKLKYTDRTCIIVIDALISDVKKQIGLIVDRVIGVLNFEEKNIDIVKKEKILLNNEYITRIGKYNENVAYILEVNNLIKEDEFTN